jgi:hypothetical protein
VQRSLPVGTHLPIVHGLNEVSAYDLTDFAEARKILCGAKLCSAVQCSAVPCSEVQCSEEQCSAVQCSAVKSSAVKSSAVKCNAVKCNAVQCSAATALDKVRVRQRYLQCQPLLQHGSQNHLFHLNNFKDSFI